MIGYRAPNNDIYAFFEKRDIELLGSSEVSGPFFTSENLAVLTAVVSEHSKEPLEMYLNKGIFHLELRREVYNDLCLRGKVGLHEGFRHVNLLEEGKLNVFEKEIYRRLKTG